MAVDYLTLIISGIFTGLGAGIGTYLAHKYFIKRTNKIMEKIESSVDVLHNKIKRRI